jgi:hypothetical protein
VVVRDIVVVVGVRERRGGEVVGTAKRASEASQRRRDNYIYAHTFNFHTYVIGPLLL